MALLGISGHRLRPEGVRGEKNDDDDDAKETSSSSGAVRSADTEDDRSR